MWNMCVGARGRERWRWLKPRNPGVIHALPSQLTELAVRPSLGGRASGIIIWGKSSPVCHLPCQVKSTKGLPNIALFFQEIFFLSWSHLSIPAVVSSSPSQPDSSTILIFPPVLLGIHCCLSASKWQPSKIGKRNTRIVKLWPGPSPCGIWPSSPLSCCKRTHTCALRCSHAFCSPQDLLRLILVSQAHQDTACFLELFQGSESETHVHKSSCQLCYILYIHCLQCYCED